MTDSRRIAALTLHALDSRDRDWILSKLSTPDRVELRVLLDELVDLAIPQDPSLVEEALARNARHRSIGVASISVERLLTLVRDEPDAVLAACINAADTTLRDQILTSIPRERHSRLHVHLARPQPAALRDALVHAMQHIAGRAGNSPGP